MADSSNSFASEFLYGSAYFDQLDSFHNDIPLMESFICTPTLPYSFDISEEFPSLIEDDTVWSELGCLFEKESSVIKSSEEEKEVKKMREDKSISKRLTKEAISKYFYLPITQAAKQLNVGLTILKKRCRELGIKRWPHRKLMSLQTLINNVQEMKKVEGEESEGKVKEAIKILEREKKQVEEVPDMQLEHKTKRLRQACFKANYKKRKNMATSIIPHKQHSSSFFLNLHQQGEHDEDEDEEIKYLLNDPNSYKNTLFF
ncbi:protein RKD1-like [Euphorbia lathyris]|uniref:protein RKD1-like n=1 Tax=Euphorbia lathyris TaxID=212925 RepID=UPI003313EC90